MCGTLIQFDGMRGSIHRNDVSSRGGMCWRRPSTYPTKGMASFCSELTLYVPTYRGCIPGVSAIGGPDPGQHHTPLPSRPPGARH